MSFLKSVKMSLSSCSLSAEQTFLITYASNTPPLRKFSGTFMPSGKFPNSQFSDDGPCKFMCWVLF